MSHLSLVQQVEHRILKEEKVSPGNRIKLLICLNVSWEKLNQPRDSKFSQKLYDIMKDDYESWVGLKCPKYQNVKRLWKHFLTTNSIEDKKGRGRKTKQLAEEVVFMMSQPGFSTRNCAENLKNAGAICSREKVRTIAKGELGAYFYHKPKHQSL